MENTKISERDERVRRLEELRKLGINPYPARAKRSHKIEQILENFDALEKNKADFDIVGRLRTLRTHGNLTFANLQDGSGKIQIALSKQEIGADVYKNFCKLIDIGDFVEINGSCFLTHKGEKSVMVKNWRLLTKSLRPLPDKFHGLQDEEERLRKRYLDILFNDDIKDMFIKKSIFWQSFREYMLKHDFLEVETPVLENITGGADAKPFITHHNALDLDVYLRISMGELWQKKLMASGYEKVFEIGRQFRNEGMSAEHAQEYTQMEFYWAYSDYTAGMEFIKDLYRFVIKKTFGTLKFKIRDFEIDLARDWEIYDYTETIKKKTGIDINKASIDEIENKLKELKINYDKEGFNITRAIDNLWKYCRKHIAGPGFLINVPIVMEPLAKKMESNPGLVERFQIILAGSEMGKGFSELNDPLDQAERFQKQQDLRESGDEEAQMYDHEFVEALEYGIPPTFGFGISERLFSFLMDKPIRECQIFPLMRPVGEKKADFKKSKEAKIAVAIINKSAKMKPWEEMNTIAHLNASFAARHGRGLLSQDEIETKDKGKIKLNIQHAIIIKEAESNQAILDLIKIAKENNLEISEFIREMIVTSDDKKLIEWTSRKDIKEMDYLGVLVFGKKSQIEKITDKFTLYKGGNRIDTEVAENDGEIGFDRDKAYEILDKYIKDTVTKMHSIESEAIMRALAKHFGENEEKWGIIGLLHDIDWDMTKENFVEHGTKAMEILKEEGGTDFLIQKITSHVYGEGSCKAGSLGTRSTKLEFSLASAETLTGLIVASTLMQPDKKLASLTFESLKKKFANQKFAARCSRDIILECENAGIAIDEFLKIGLTALKEISDKLGL